MFLEYIVENASTRSIKTLMGELLYAFKNKFAHYRNDSSPKHAMVIDLRFKLSFIGNNQIE